ncbi:MAG: GerMN domain-containing protein [Candidatus Krumholzibacteria bacterium]|nr:GerMN domain-containing protein [Candidatus Krumholzibacteria bacterium]
MRSSTGNRIFQVLLVLVIVIVLFALITKYSNLKKERSSGGISPVPEETRSVTLFYASRQADGMLSETREIAVTEGLEEQVKQVLKALVLGPEDDKMVSAIPAGTEVLQVFWVEDTQTLFIDFNRALLAAHTGGSAGEYYTISMVLKTVASNFPQVRNLQFLVDGYPVETIAGHYAIAKPLDIMRWR